MIVQRAADRLAFEVCRHHCPSADSSCLYACLRLSPTRRDRALAVKLLRMMNGLPANPPRLPPEYTPGTLRLTKE